MKMTAAYSSMAVLAGTLSILLISTVAAAPLDTDDEELSDNSVMDRLDSDGSAWDAVDTAALRKLLLQLDTEERLSRVSRAWTGTGARSWTRSDGRPLRPWRADKRQVRFRQCYFNPISCFRK